MGDDHDLCRPWRDSVPPVRKVLEGMKASLDLGATTLSSEKHGIQNMKLGQAANGHLLMPLLPDDGECCFAAETGLAPQGCDRKEYKKPPKVMGYKAGTPKSLRSAFQSILRNTRHCQVDVVAHQEALQTLFGSQAQLALCAYRPKFERIPAEAHCQTLLKAVATQIGSSEPEVTTWQERPAGKRRSTFDHAGACIFAFCRPTVSVTAAQHPSQPSIPADDCTPQTPVGTLVTPDKAPSSPISSLNKTLPTTKAQQHLSGDDSSEASESEMDCCASGPGAAPGSDLVALFEKCNWVDLDVKQAPSSSKSRIAHQVSALGRVPFQLAEEPDRVQRELKEWLGPQYKTPSNGKVDFVEVFTGTAPLSPSASLVQERARASAHSRVKTSEGHVIGGCWFC